MKEVEKWKCPVCRLSTEITTNFCHECGHHRYLDMLAHIDRDMHWAIFHKADASWRQSWIIRALQSEKQYLQFLNDTKKFKLNSAAWYAQPFPLVKPHDAT